ncbi:SMI1/KNR4 family protein [Runella sp. SP2]|uniref:SMI1/KNR4 family protein n=1 Tax=Runella sp. SP2 TaxID=2268026 RepID=UPI000F099C1D|nr:SMI1/KNR4 family protein [Runella sp. SP2]AYQ31948.1 SMI1/KNR4 family protein [Runella sp. SP2]
MPFPVDIKYIIETEQELGLVFPDNFKSKMTKENGGELITEDDDWQLFPFFDKSDNKRMSRTCNHIVLETQQARTWNNFPDNGIAIASNGSGDNLILLPLDTDNKKLREEIYLWQHETGDIQQVAKTKDELTEE